MPLADPGPGPETLIVLALLGLVVACAWPRAALLVALASLAVRPEVLLGGAALSHAWGIQHSLLAAALAGCAWRYGVRREVSWPILAFAAVFALSFLLGDLHPGLTAWAMLGALGVLCLPWLFVQVALPPGSRQICALTLALLPSANVLLGLLLQSPDRVYGVFHHKGFEDTYRLVGVEGDPGLLALLAFIGFAVALHESTRPGRPWAPLLAILNLAIVVLTVTRMGILASLLLLAAYIALSPSLRERVLRQRRLLLLGTGVVLALFAATLPSMLERVTASQSWILSGGRDLIWPHYWEEFLLAPLFGRGFGTGFLDMTPVPRKSPHNEYLHLLVIGGLAGLVLGLIAIAAWFWRLLSRVSPNDREFILALLPVIAMYAVTEDVLTLPGALALWAYLGTLLTRPALVPLTEEELEEEWQPVGDHGIDATPRGATAATARPWPGWPPSGDRTEASHWHQARAAGTAMAAVGQPGASPTGMRMLAWRPLDGHEAALAGEASTPPPRPASQQPPPASGSSYWVKTFPLARRLLQALAADRLIMLLLLLLFASLAIGSTILGAQLGENWERSWHKLLLLGAVGLMALRFGLRLLPNWALVALLALLPLNLVLADRLEDLSIAMTLRTFVGLALPFLFIHVVFAWRDRPYYCIALASAPLVSSLLGIAMLSDWSFGRFGGATNAAFLGASGFFGFAIAAHEYGQKRQSAFLALAFLCLLVVMVSGSRMAWFSSFLFAGILYVKSANLKEVVRNNYSILLPGLVILAILFALYIPFMESRLVGWSNRDVVWEFFWYEVSRAPVFGRGLGASETLRLHHGIAATHNEYIRLLVDAGLVGLLLVLIGILAWFRQLLRLLPSEHRAFVWAMAPCLVAYAATDNILAMTAALAVFVYFALLIDDRGGPAADGLGTDLPPRVA